LYPDTLTFTFLAMPPAINNIIHFQVSGSAYPNFGTLTLPPGTMMGLSGQTLDAVQVLLDSAGFFVDISNVSRVTF
jgi:hypothetical protein